MLKAIKKLLGLGKKEVKNVVDNVLESLDWAEKEIKEAEEKLVDLYHKIHEGIVELENVIQSSDAIIKRHQEILEKAKNRKIDFQAKSQKVSDLLTAIEKELKHQQ